MREQRKARKTGRVEVQERLRGLSGGCVEVLEGVEV